MEFSLKTMVALVIGVMTAVVLGALITTQFSGTEVKVMKLLKVG